MLMDFEKRLMDDSDLFEESVVKTSRQRVQRQFEEKNRLLRRMSWYLFAVAIAVLVFGLLMMICFGNDATIGTSWGVVVLIGSLTMVFNGLISCTHYSRISVMRGLKELRIQVAELADRIPPQSAGEGIAPGKPKDG